MNLQSLHSPSCAYYNGELYVAFYAGERECVNQRVVIFKKRNGKFIFHRYLPVGSGNPALMIHNGILYCCYSMFTKIMQDNVFDLWKTTYTCVENVVTSNEKYILSTYCCPRINPFYLSDGSLILPCYDESIERGIFFHFRTGKTVERYVCMKDFPVIQPSLVEKDGKIISFFRNFKSGIRFTPEECYAPYSEIAFSAARKSIVFGDIKKSKIPNHNESISTFNDKEKTPLVVYNAEKDRQALTLGIIERDKNMDIVANPLLQLNDSPKASYPNCCFNNKNQLVVVFSSYEKGINFGSSICVATISCKYDKIISRKYITSEMIPQLI